jgi:glycosyltransferase involved in cell wall biosynthesis
MDRAPVTGAGEREDHTMIAQRDGLVSVIIPVYNRPALLADAIQSAIDQTYRPIEVIVIDDGSTDETPQTAARFAAAHRSIVQSVRVPHGGVAQAMNEGLRRASGEFVQILDSDDLLLPEKLTLQVQGLREHPECGISYGLVREYEIGRAWSGRPARRTGVTYTHLFPAILAEKIWPAPSPLFRRSVIEKIGEFVDVSIQTEWEFECRAAALGVRLHHCRAYVAETRGAHRIEGRRKASATVEQLAELATVLELILAHARAANVAPGDLDRLAARFFSLARRLAAAGREAIARRCLALAREIAAQPHRRLSIDLFAATANRCGWQRTAAGWVTIERSRAAAAGRFIKRHVLGFSALWRYRAAVARQTITGQSLFRWPSLLVDKWSARASAQPAIRHRHS